MKRFASIALVAVLGFTGFAKADGYTSHYNWPDDNNPMFPEVKEDACDLAHGLIDTLEDYSPFTSNEQLEQFRQEHITPECPRVETPSYNSGGYYHH